MTTAVGRGFLSFNENYVAGGLRRWIPRMFLPPRCAA